MAYQRKQSRIGFTLVELLVVIGIIGVLIAILLPVMGRVQQTARRTACASNLREIGSFFQMYINEHKLRVPRVNPVPSNPNFLGYPAPSILDVLSPYAKGANKVYLCPADRIINTTDNGGMTGPNGQTVDTYFEREGSSYEYNTFFNAFSSTDERTGINKVWTDALADIGRRGRQPTDIDIFRDMDPFHDKAGSEFSRNYLFADFHVGPRPQNGSRF